MNFWHFGNNPALFFNSLLVLVVLFLIMGQWKAASSSQEGVENPLVEISKFDFYVMDADGVSIAANIQSAQHYADRNRLNDVMIERMQGEVKEKIVMPQVLQQERVFTFSNGLAYTSERGLAFTSETGVYDQENETFQGKGTFALRQGESTMDGKNIYLKRSPEMIRGDDVRLILKEGDR